MRFERGGWALICYAGSASEASIGSKPFGAELSSYVVLRPQVRQASFSRTQVRVAQNKRQPEVSFHLHNCDCWQNYPISGSPRSHRPTATRPVVAHRNGVKASTLEAEYGPRQP